MRSARECEEDGEPARASAVLHGADSFGLIISHLYYKNRLPMVK